MYRIIVGLLLALVIIVLLAPDTSASYVGEGPMTNPEALSLVALSVEDWQAKGLNTCPVLRTFEADDLWYGDNYAIAGLGGECRLWIARDEWTNLTPHQKCIVVLHEVGHALGLPHGTGVMAEYPYDEVVPMCDAWVAEPVAVLTASEARRATRIAAYEQGLPKGVRVRLPRCKSHGGDQVCRIAWRAPEGRYEVRTVVRKTGGGVTVLRTTVAIDHDKRTSR